MTTVLFELMANYNWRMNKAVYASALELSDDELAQDRGAFFGSIMGTLNHIYVGDVIWLKRFADHPAAFTALEPVRKLPKPVALSQVICHDLAGLRQYREALDKVLLAFVAELTESVLATDLSYTNTKGLAFRKPLGALILHVFNHQTHHRGQVSTLLNQAGRDLGVTDLLLDIPGS